MFVHRYFGGVLRVLHEGGVLLEEGWVYCRKVGSSCSTHNPWPVDPDPRSVGRLEVRLKAEPASSHSPPALCADGGQGAEGRTCAEAPGSAARTPDSLLRGLVSTVLTLTGSASVFPAGIVGILRFLFDVRRRCACDVSTVDTHTASCLASWTTSLPRAPARASVSEVMTLKRLRCHDTQMSQK